MLDNLMLMKDLSDSEKLLFQNEFSMVRKDSATAVLLAFLLGGFGAHQFYMGRIFLGIVYCIFFWTLIPATIAVIECFFLPNRVNNYNKRKSEELIIKIKALRPVGSTDIP